MKKSKYNSKKLPKFGTAGMYKNANTINNTIDSVAGSAIPWYTYAKTASGIVKSMTSPTTVTDPTTGKVVTQSSNKTNQAFSDTFTPVYETAIKDFTDGNTGRGVLDILTGGVYNTLDNYVNGTNQKEFDKAKANETTYNQQQADLANQQNMAYQQQQDSYINGMITKGINNYTSQNKGSYVQYPNGGVNMLPNAEVEKEENSVAPNGQFTQYNGPSHGQGGIKTNLVPGEMIFSDKLKLGNKTFAQLNKVNNTNKQDKILDNPNSDRISKKTAELLRMAKLKNSEMLFKQQEDLKQSKVFNYAKKMGVNLSTDNEQLETQGQSEQSEGEMKYGGYNLYPNGGITPDQYKQAQVDSMLLYNAGLKSNKVPSFQYPGAMEAAGRLAELNGTAPNTIKGEFYNNQPNYTGGYNVAFKKPTMLPYQEPKITSTINTPSYHPKYNSYIPGIDKSKQPVNIEQFEDGGEKDPNDINALNARQQRDYQAWFNANSQNEGFNSDEYSVDNYMKQYESRGAKLPTNTNKSYPPQYSSYAPGVLGQNDSGNTPDNPYQPPPSQDYSNFNQQKYDEDLATANKRIENKKVDWNKLGTQVGLGIANNAGNIYNLIRSNKPEVTKFQRANASLVDPTAALRDATDQTRRAEYNVRGASGGNAGTYLSNRVALNAQNIVNKDRIRKEYANINAGILNQNSQFNTDIANQEYVANEQNRAQTRNIKGQAIADVGSNVVSQYRDNKAQQYDQNTLDNMSEFYNALKNDPYAKARWEKIKKGYK